MNAVVAQTHQREERGYIDILLDKDRLALEERVLQWRTYRHILQPIVDELQPICINVKFPDSLDFHMAGDKASLVRAIRAFRRAGYSSNAAKPKPGDTSWSAFFRCPACPVSIWFNFSSTVCRKVKVGTQMVEQDVYETICDSDVTDLPELNDVAPMPVVVDANEVPF